MSLGLHSKVSDSQKYWSEAGRFSYGSMTDVKQGHEEGIS